MQSIAFDLAGLSCDDPSSSGDLFRNIPEKHSTGRQTETAVTTICWPLLALSVQVYLLSINESQKAGTKI